MKKLLCIVLLLFCVSFAYAEERPEFEFDFDGIIMVGESLKGNFTMTLEGEPVPFKDVTCKLVNDERTMLLNIDQFRTDINGKVDFVVTTPASITPGEYWLIFSIQGSEFSHMVIIEDSNFTLHLNKYYYQMEDTISVYGAIKSDDVNLTFTLVDMNNDSIKTIEVDVVDHEYNFELDIPNKTFGTYGIKIDNTTHIFHVTDAIDRIYSASDVQTKYSKQPNMPKNIKVRNLDGSKTMLPVTWDLSNFVATQVSTKYIPGLIDGKYNTSIHVTVLPYKKVDKDDKDDKEKDKPKKVETIDDIIPRAGKDATDTEKKEVKDKADELLKNMKTNNASADDIKILNKSLNQALELLQPEDAVALAEDMTDLISESMHTLSRSDATTLVKDMINESYSQLTARDALTKTEKKVAKKAVQKLIQQLYEDKAAITEKNVTSEHINDAIKTVQSIGDSLETSLNENEFDVEKKVTVNVESSLQLDEASIKSLSENQMGLTVKAGGVDFTLPSALIKSLSDGVSFDHNAINPSLNKKTPNGTVKNLKTLDLTVSSKGKSLENVTLSISLDDIDVDLDALMVGVYENDQWTKLDYVIEDNTIIFTAPHFSVYSVMSYQSSFTDIENWAQSYITSLAAKGIVSGKSETTFDPNGTITRAEFVTMLINHLNIDQTAIINFDDAEGWYSNYLAIAKENELYYGHDKNNFRPMDNITREEMAVLIQQAYKLKYNDTLEGITQPFSDHNLIAEDAVEAIYAMKANSIISGYEDNTFRPQLTATRAEAASMIYMFLEK